MHFTTKTGPDRLTWEMDKIMDRLTELGIKHETDKAAGHHFTEFYYDYVSKFVNPKLLEIGIWDGGSLKMWEEFYGNPTIVGVDIMEKSRYDTTNIKTIVADQSNPEDMRDRCKQICPEYDIIIDDGSHIIDHQISSFAKLFPILKSGGVYILEDLHTSFIGGQYNPRGDQTTAYDFLYRVSRHLEVYTPCASEEEIKYLAENIEFAKVFQLHEEDFLHSITSVIIKK
jgi:hypothetical protein